MAQRSDRPPGEKRQGASWHHGHRVLRPHELSGHFDLQAGGGSMREGQRVTVLVRYVDESARGQRPRAVDLEEAPCAEAADESFDGGCPAHRVRDRGGGGLGTGFQDVEHGQHRRMERAGRLGRDPHGVTLHARAGDKDIDLVRMGWIAGVFPPERKVTAAGRQRGEPPRPFVLVEETRGFPIDRRHVNRDRHVEVGVPDLEQLGSESAVVREVSLSHHNSELCAAHPQATILAQMSARTIASFSARSLTCV